MRQDVRDRGMALRQEVDAHDIKARQREDVIRAEFETREAAMRTEFATREATTRTESGAREAMRAEFLASEGRLTAQVESLINMIMPPQSYYSLTLYYFARLLEYYLLVFLPSFYIDHSLRA